MGSRFSRSFPICLVWPAGGRVRRRRRSRGGRGRRSSCRTCTRRGRAAPSGSTSAGGGASSFTPARVARRRRRDAIVRRRRRSAACRRWSYGSARRRDSGGCRSRSRSPSIFDAHLAALRGRRRRGRIRIHEAVFARVVAYGRILAERDATNSRVTFDHRPRNARWRPGGHKAAAQAFARR